MKGEYEQIGDGWEVVPKELRLACCDCSLTHDIWFRVRMVDKTPRLEWKVDRNERATAALRRKRKRASSD